MENTLKTYMKETYKYGFLTEETEKELGTRARQGDACAREQLINTHLKMVFTIAKRFNRSTSTPLEDLIQEGNLGLVIAADNFNPEKNVRFANYAKWWIMEFIKRKFYKELYIVNSPLRVVKKTFQASIKDKKLDKEVKLGENKAINQMIQRPVYLGEIIYSTQGEKPIDYSETLKDERNDMEQKAELKDVVRFLSKRVRYYLGPEESHIIERRYLEDGYQNTYKEIGKELNVSSETVRNMERRAMQKLRAKMKKDFSSI